LSQIEEQRFEFGKNWHDFIQKTFSKEQVQISKRHILEFMGRSNLDGLSVLDIGCGSGLHSSAMLDAGAASVHGFDYDENSVKATRFIQEQLGKPSNWTAEQGSVLDDAYVGRLPLYDFVYSWGVLHHTGDVWHAIRNAASRVKPGGLFYIALYSADVQVDPTPEFWLGVKRKYVSSGWATRRMMDWWYVWRFQINKNLFMLPDFVKRMREYKKNRGMNIFTDIRDWLGGWPMEFVYDKDAIAFVEKLGFKLEKIATGEANSEFLFVRASTAASP
jgi:SAM-dependent methyltransferase